MQAPGGGLKSAVTGTQFHQLADSQLVCVPCMYTVVLLLCFTYVREPDHKGYECVLASVFNG